MSPKWSQVWWRTCFIFIWNVIFIILFVILVIFLIQTGIVCQILSRHSRQLTNNLTVKDNLQKERQAVCLDLTWNERSDTYSDIYRLARNFFFPSQREYFLRCIENYLLIRNMSLTYYNKWSSLNATNIKYIASLNSLKCHFLKLNIEKKHTFAHKMFH